MTNLHIAAIAQTLLAARRDRQPADPAQHVDQLQSTDDAYAVQELVRKELAPGKPPSAVTGNQVPLHAPLTYCRPPFSRQVSGPAPRRRANGPLICV